MQKWTAIGLFLTGIVLVIIGYFLGRSTTSIVQKPVFSPTPAKQTLGAKEKTSQADLQEVFLVTKVVDGDTIQINSGQTVRYIGIDTPETSDPRTGVQCFGKEAAAKNRELVEGKQVHLEKDISETDRYGRLLRYVFVGDVFVNDELVRQGFAHASAYPPDVAFQDQFREAEQEAREQKRGLWAACDVWKDNGDSSVSSSDQSSPKAQFVGEDKDCGDFKTHDEAQAFFITQGGPSQDPHKLDQDKDGIACETLP